MCRTALASGCNFNYVKSAQAVAFGRISGVTRALSL